MISRESAFREAIGQIIRAEQSNLEGQNPIKNPESVISSQARIGLCRQLLEPSFEKTVQELMQQQ